MPPKPIGDLLKLKDNGELGRALRRSSDIGHLTAALASGLADELGDSILAASVDAQGTLNVKTTSSAWASRLRFEEAALLEACRAVGQPATRLTVRVGRPGGET